MKRYSTVPRSTKWEPNYQMNFSVIQRTLLFGWGWGSRIPLQEIESVYSKPHFNKADKKVSLLAREGRLKRYRDRINQYHQNRTFPLKENLSNKWKENERGHTNKRMQRKQNYFRVRYENKKGHNRMAGWINSMEKVLLWREESTGAIIHLKLLRATLKSTELESSRSWRHRQILF